MATFSAKDVNDLRKATGVGMMDCKKALTEADGDMEKATVILREKGLATQASKAGRIAAEGLVTAVVAGNVGALVEVNSETDFVAQNDGFKSFVATVANTVIAANPADLDALNAAKTAEGPTVDETLQELFLKIRENMKVRRFERMEGILVPYVHGGGTIAVMVKLEADGIAADNAELLACGKDVALQIAAMNANYLCREDVPASALEDEKKILLAQMAEDPKMANKPEQVRVKIVEGKIGKYYSENCLLEQEFVKDGDMTVGKYVEETAKKLGGSIKVASYVRYEKGEGLEKKVDNFADEVASMAGTN